jgi:hypothetical protein
MGEVNMKLAAATCLLLSTLSSALSAQEPATLPRGLSVRVTDAAGDRFTGRIQSTDAAALRVRRPNGQVVNLPRERVARLEVGSTRNFQRRGAIAGGALGLAAGLAIDTRSSDDGCGCGSMIPATPFLALIGTGAGFLVGTVVRPARWTDIPLDRVRVGVGPVRGKGVAVRVAIAF